MNKIQLLFGAAAVLTSTSAMLLAASAAHAKDVTVIAQLEDGVPVARIGYADLDLTSTVGKRTLKARVAGGASKVCQPMRDGTDPNRYNECLNAALTEARPQVAAVVARAERIAAGAASATDRLASNEGIRVGVAN